MVKVTIEVAGYVFETRLEDVPQVGDEVELTAEVLTDNALPAIPEHCIGGIYLVTGRRWKQETKTLCLLELKRLL